MGAEAAEERQRADAAEERQPKRGSAGLVE